MDHVKKRLKKRERERERERVVKDATLSLIHVFHI